MLLPAGFRKSAQRWRGYRTGGDAQLIHVVRSALPFECRHRYQIGAATLEAVYKLGIGREVGEVKWLVVKRDAIQAMGIKPAAGRCQNRDRRIERRKSGESFE